MVNMKLLKFWDPPVSLKNKMCLKYLFLQLFSRKEVLNQRKEDEEEMQ